MAINTTRVTTVTLSRLPSGGDFLELSFRGATDNDIVDVVLSGDEDGRTTFTIGQLRGLVAQLKRDGLDLSAYADMK